MVFERCANALTTPVDTGVFSKPKWPSAMTHFAHLQMDELPIFAIGVKSSAST